ncbi:MAG: hypothetical protein HYV34_01975 [Candidatus Kerfeldbacteria bacterium]|nr:hypothetical protein [Candidatus Kerfeldbacteria bacterium]
MKLSDVATGEWFTTRFGGFYIKTSPFLRGTTTFWAVSLTDGIPKFRAPTGTHNAPLEEDVEIVPKPDWVKPEETDSFIVFNDSERRDEAVLELRREIPSLVLEASAKPEQEKYFISYRASEALNNRIDQVLDRAGLRGV